MSSFINICRFCLIEDTSLININTVCENEDIKLITKVECILPEIDFNESNLSNSLCQVCCNKLKFAYEFKQKCISNNRLLQLHRDSSIKIRYKIESMENIIETDICTEKGLLGFHAVNDKYVPIYSSTANQEENFDRILEPESRPNVEDIKLKTVRVMLSDIRHDLQNILKTTKISRRSLNLIKKTGRSKCVKVITPKKLNGEIIHKSGKEGIQTSQNNQTENIQTTHCLTETNTDSLLDIDKLPCLIINDQVELEKHKKIRNPLLDQYEVVEVRIFEKTIKAKTYPCRICAKTFKMKSTLKEHLRVHTDPRPDDCANCGSHCRCGNKPQVQSYGCEDCNRSYRSMNALRIHRRVHTGEMPYSCSACNLRFRHSGLFKYHMRKLHGGYSPYKCDVCGTVFPHKLLLFQHSAVHNDSLPYQCKVCHFYFPNEKRFKNHLLSHPFEECSST